MDEAVQFVVGLGNPGADYVLTRHNAGYWFVDALARRYGGQFHPERKFSGDTCRITIDGHDLRLLKPTTFMNRSGQSVQSLASYLKVSPKAMLVAHDDLDLPIGAAKLKWNGGHGGHNGLRDIINRIGAEFRRLRIGIGRPPQGRDVINYVLKRAGETEETRIMESIAAAIEVMPVLLESGMEKAMHKLHSLTGE